MGGGGGGGGGRGRAAPPPPPCCPVYTPQSVVSRCTPTHLRIRAASGRQWTGGVDTVHSSFAAAHLYLSFPFSGYPVSSQYLDTLLSYLLGLSLVPLLCLIPSCATEAISTGLFVDLFFMNCKQY